MSASGGEEVIAYTTLNSVYTVDVENRRYMRQGRNGFQAPELRNLQGSPALKEDQWLPLDPDLPVDELAFLSNEEGHKFLILRYPGSNFGVWTSEVLAIEVRNK
jgi:hypothetical protein